MGVADKMTVVVWSEFSRGAAERLGHGPRLAGTGVRHRRRRDRRVYGNHPNIDGAALDDNGNSVYSQTAGAFRSTDFRDVYGTILKHWLNMSEPTIVSGVFPLDSGDPDTRWTTQQLRPGLPHLRARVGHELLRAAVPPRRVEGGGSAPRPASAEGRRPPPLAELSAVAERAQTIDLLAIEGAVRGGRTQALLRHARETRARCRAICAWGCGV